MKNYKFYVTATDKFLSGWGRAEGKISKIVFPCKTIEQAEKVFEKLKNRKDMSYIYIRTTEPYYNSSDYHTSVRQEDEVLRLIENY